MPITTQSPKPKICLVYDRVTTKYGGAEYLLQQLLEVFPDAPLYTVLYNPKIANWVEQNRVRAVLTTTSPLTNVWQKLLTPFLPLAFESLDLNEYNIIISISSAEAKGVLTSPNQAHINYLFSPPKYLAKESASYLRSHGVFKIPGLLTLAQLPLKYLRWWDQAAAARPDHIIPISKRMAAHLRGSYAKNLLDPIYPPVAMPKGPVKTQQTATPYFLSLARLVWYKRIDLAIAAALNTNALLVIAGEGTMGRTLLAQAGKSAYERRKTQTIAQCICDANNSGKHIVFLNAVTQQEKSALLSAAIATIQMGKEDFGIVAIESLSHGTPAILFAKSGAAEIVRNGQDGLVLFSQTTSSLSDAFERINTMHFSDESLRKQAKKVSAKMYQKAIKTIVYDVWKTHSNGVKNYAT